MNDRVEAIEKTMIRNDLYRRVDAIKKSLEIDLEKVEESDPLRAYVTGRLDQVIYLLPLIADDKYIRELNSELT